MSREWFDRPDDDLRRVEEDARRHDEHADRREVIHPLCGRCNESPVAEGRYVYIRVGDYYEKHLRCEQCYETAYWGAVNDAVKRDINRHDDPAQWTGHNDMTPDGRDIAYHNRELSTQLDQAKHRGVKSQKNWTGD